VLLRKLFLKSTPAVAVICAALLVPGDAILLMAQDAPPPPPQNQAPLLPPEQLDSLAAPVALYPDPLLSQILVAATYPLELVQASQWLQQNRGLSGPALTQAAAQQNWDPSVQALVVFPDLIQRLTQDITWTTNLGNAFLAQQGDVMDAVQRLRERAEQAGKLASTPQQNGGRRVIEIVPASPEVIYVPQYDPAYIWGPPVFYPYPRWYYPRPGIALVGGGFFGFGVGISMGLYFGGGWGGWGGWGQPYGDCQQHLHYPEQFQHNPQHRYAWIERLGARFIPSTRRPLSESRRCSTIWRRSACEFGSAKQPRPPRRIPELGPGNGRISRQRRSQSRQQWISRQRRS
jgi:hypothetical protein